MNLLSHYLDSTTPCYGNAFHAQFSKASCICDGASSNSLKMTFSNHIGTHIDLPRHFDDNGLHLNDYAPESWFFKQVQLLDIPLKDEELLSVSHLEGKIEKNTEVLLVRSCFEDKRGKVEYWQNNPGIEEEVGLWFRKNFPNLQILGFDFISVSSFQKRDIGRKAHKTLLAMNFEGKPLRVIEDMKLAHLKRAPKNLLISPLLVSQADGIQVTVWGDISI
jgi:arylformamidase